MFPVSTLGPPPCYGTGYDNDSPRCAACSFHRSCRQEVVKSGVMMYYPQYAPVGAQQTPQQFYSPGPAQFIPSAPPPPQPWAQTQPAQYRPPPWTPPTPPSSFRIPVQQAPVSPQVQQPMIATQPGALPPWAPIHFQIPNSLAPSNIGYYGYYPDNMWGAVAAVAPVWRPQQTGESFGVRVMKNMALVLLEHAFQQLMFATRQAFLPPAGPPTSKDAVIDVTPVP